MGSPAKIKAGVPIDRLLATGRNTCANSLTLNGHGAVTRTHHASARLQNAEGLPAGFANRFALFAVDALGLRPPAREGPDSARRR